MKRVLFFLPMLLLAAGSILGGCTLPSIGADERAYALIAGLNTSSRELVADNFRQDIADYATLLDPSLYPDFWETYFPIRNAPYSVTALDASNPAAVTLTLADNQGTWGPMDVVLEMSLVGNDRFVSRMLMDPSPAAPPVTVIVQ